MEENFLKNKGFWKLLSLCYMNLATNYILWKYPPPQKKCEKCKSIFTHLNRSSDLSDREKETKPCCIK